MSMTFCKSRKLKCNFEMKTFLKKPPIIYLKNIGGLIKNQNLVIPVQKSI